MRLALSCGLVGPPNSCLNDWHGEYLSVDAAALALGSSSTRSRGSAQAALNKGPGKSAENLLAFLLLLIICDVFQVRVRKLVLERALTG